MKKNDSLAESHRLLPAPAARRRKFAFFALLFLGLSLSFAHGAKLKEARVTQVVRDVKLLPGQAAPRPAAVSDQIREGTAVRTGLESRAELTFTDATLARLGANTIFSFDQGTRNLELGGGAMLLRVPKNSGGAQINTAAITAAITGTTMLIEYHPDAYCKYIMLEGVARIFRNNKVGESILLHPGQMLIVNPKGTGLPEPVEVDLERLMKTSILITGFDPLPSTDLIAQEIGAQDAQKKEGGLLDTNLVIFNDNVVSLLDPTNSNIADQANANEMRQAMLSSTPTPTPTPVTPPPIPDKFGTPSVISSPVPYVIGSGTTITTDPTITTNGVTDFGKIYRGSALDGSASTFAFGSTSAFDTQISFDERIDDPGTLPGAVFKFTALQLAGNPTVSLDNGGVPNLGLISVGDITSAAPGGVLTFDGIDALLLATVDGSITLGPEISFEGISRLFFYARGAGSTLTLDSAISGSTDLTLISEGDIVFNNAFDLAESGAIDRGLHFDAITGTNLIANNGLTITLDNSSGGDTLDESARILISPGQDLTANGDAGLNLTIANNAGGHIGGGASIEVFPNGDLTASALTFLINSRDAGSIDGDASILLDATGAVNVTNDAEFVITTRNDGLGGGTINGGASITFDAASVSTGGFMDLALSANAGGTLSNATILVNVPGAVVTTGGYSSEIQSTGFNVFGGPFIQGGMITGDALLTLNLGSVSSGDFFDIEIDNNGAGTIGGNALISIGITGDLDTGSDIFADIINTAAEGDETIPGGTIGGSATVAVGVVGDIISAGVGEFAVLNNDMNFLSEAGTIMGDALVSVSATNITTGGFFQPVVNNTNGVINGNATDLVLATGDVNVGAETFFNILNTNGTIGGQALSTLAANNFTSGSTFGFQILNDSGGSIGTNAILEAALGGNLTSIGDAFLEIVNSNGGSIGGETLVEINLGSLAANATVNSGIFNHIGGLIDGDAVVDFNVAGALTAESSVFFQIWNFGDAGVPAGTIGGDTSISVSAGQISASIGSLPSLTAEILNQNAGLISGNAIIDFNLSGTLDADTATFTVNNIGGTIGQSASIDLTDTGALLTGTLNLTIDNNTNNGAIGGDAAINVSATSLQADSLTALIDNTAGTIGGSATINSTFTSAVSVSGDANLNIFGSDAATGGAAINFNGGTYNVGGTFLGTIDGDGAITFNNAAVHADILKVGALGTNGTLTIGGGSLSGDTTLKLYASGSNGTVNFISNVSLSSNSSVLIAGNTVTVNDGVTVTIAGDDGVAASVFTNVPNYSGSGGNGKTTGTFDGNGAQTFPLDQAPSFDDPLGPNAPATNSATVSTAPLPATNSASPGNGGTGTNPVARRGQHRVPTVRVTDSNELLALADRVPSGSSATRRGRANGPSGTRTATSVSLGKKGVAPSMPLAVATDLALRHNEGRPPAALP